MLQACFACYSPDTTAFWQVDLNVERLCNMCDGQFCNAAPYLVNAGHGMHARQVLNMLYTHV